VVAAAQLTQRSRGARPVKYARHDPQAATIASRTIRWGGVLLLLFIVFHILHFTTGRLHPAFMEGDPYANLVNGFTRQRWVALFYIAMMIVLGLHLYHGVWSAFRTLGATPPSAYPLRHRVAGIVAVALWLGFTAVPVGVLLGFIGWNR
jgi:succinate dehydrogenase / fumarate reductase, cytochrome b subunit